MASYSSLKFPFKLWKIVKECKNGAISWDSSGKIIQINYKSFKRDYLASEFGFKTSNMTSFIRQLNLYGFRKLSAYSCKARNIHAYQNDYFVRNDKSLLDFVSRKPSGVKRQKKKVTFREKVDSKLRKSRLTLCQKVLSKALIKVASKKKDLSRRRSVKKEDITAVEYFEQVDEEEESFEKYDSIFLEDSYSAAEDDKDSIPIVLPQEIALDTESEDNNPWTNYMDSLNEANATTEYLCDERKKMEFNNPILSSTGENFSQALFQDVIELINIADDGAGEKFESTSYQNSSSHSFETTSVQVMKSPIDLLESSTKSPDQLLPNVVIEPLYLRPQTVFINPGMSSFFGDILNFQNSTEFYC